MSNGVARKVDQLGRVVLPVEMRDVERAKTIIYGKRISARDALHLATMERHGATRIMSFDAGFDGIPGVIRLH